MNNQTVIHLDPARPVRQRLAFEPPQPDADLVVTGDCVESFIKQCYRRTFQPSRTRHLVVHDGRLRRVSMPLDLADNANPNYETMVRVFLVEMLQLVIAGPDLTKIDYHVEAREEEYNQLMYRQLNVPIMADAVSRAQAAVSLRTFLTCDESFHFQFILGTLLDSVVELNILPLNRDDNAFNAENWILANVDQVVHQLESLSMPCPARYPVPVPNFALATRMKTARIPHWFVYLPDGELNVQFLQGLEDLTLLNCDCHAPPVRKDAAVLELPNLRSLTVIGPRRNGTGWNYQLNEGSLSCLRLPNLVSFEVDWIHNRDHVWIAAILNSAKNLQRLAMKCPFHYFTALQDDAIRDDGPVPKFSNIFGTVKNLEVGWFQYDQHGKHLPSAQHPDLVHLMQFHGLASFTVRYTIFVFTPDTATQMVETFGPDFQLIVWRTRFTILDNAHGERIPGNEPRFFHLHGRSTLRLNSLQTFARRLRKDSPVLKMLTGSRNHRNPLVVAATRIYRDVVARFLATQGARVLRDYIDYGLIPADYKRLID